MAISEEDREILINRIVELAKTIDDYEMLRKLYIFTIRFTSDD